MTGDTNNPGWYYKDMDFEAKGYRWDYGDGKETTPIKPGETLMIFYSFINDGADLHRCPQHMAPGIPFLTMRIEKVGYFTTRQQTLIIVFSMRSR